MNRKEINIHERRGRTDVSRFRIEKTDGRIHREIQPDEREVSEGTQEVNISGSQNGRLRRTYDRDSAESRGENGRTASGADENSRSDRRTESSRPDEVGRNSEQLQTAGRGDDQRGDYIQLSLFPESPQEQADYGTAAGVSPAAVFDFPDSYIDECLRTGGNNQDSFEYILFDLVQENPSELLTGDLKKMWVGGKGLAMSDGVKVSVWYSEDGISFHHGNGARKNPEKTISWVEAAERIESLYQNGQFTTKELQEKAFDTIRTRIAEYVFFFYRDSRLESRWGSVYIEAVEKITGELRDPIGVNTIYEELLSFEKRVDFETGWQKRNFETAKEHLKKLNHALKNLSGIIIHLALILVYRNSAHFLSPFLYFLSVYSLFLYFPAAVNKDILYFLSTCGYVFLPLSMSGFSVYSLFSKEILLHHAIHLNEMLLI